MKEYDTIITGTGPVGSHLAYKLAQPGYKVLVVDKKANPGDNVYCTGIISKECLDSFPIDNSLILRELQSAKFFSPSGECLRLWRDDLVAAIVDRPALNISLAEQAQKAGADYLFGATVTDIESDSNTAKVTISNKNQDMVFKAKAVVIATGFGSALPKKLGLGEIRHFLFGAQTEVGTAIDEVEVYFNQNLAPGGFAWLVPTRDSKGLAGLLTKHQADFHFKSFLNTLLSQDKITPTKVTPQYSLIPLKPLAKTYTNRILVVGEAAGQVKPTTGGGVYYGLLCADVAASVLHQSFVSNNFSAEKLSTYERQWRARLGRELTIGYRARWFYDLLNNRSIDYIFRLAAKHGVAEKITNTRDFSFDWHSRLFLQMMPSLLPFTKVSMPL